MLVITLIEVLPEMGDMIPLVILLLWPHISLYFIIFKGLSHVSSNLIVTEREFLIVKGTSVLPFRFLRFNSCGIRGTRSTASGGHIL